ncbi:unnamed protein product [Euphydryas editha]|uniref:Reverse transcriptase n=1 Tax=Euphydryas editha TaxID=104508 RepID=A0AAU9UVR3_EUPED|nr:unnamed protein product [Euphydryas editha]
MSDPYRLECVVRQGGLTSPLGCHVDDVDMNNLSNTDDMVLLSVSIRGMISLIQICEKYTSRHGLKYNLTKSQCMIFEAFGTICSQNIPPVLLSGVRLKTVGQIKYLGNVITTNLRDDADIERERRALSVRVNMVARRFARYSAQMKMILFKAYCIFLYTCIPVG